MGWRVGRACKRVFFFSNKIPKFHSISLFQAHAVHASKSVEAIATATEAATQNPGLGASQVLPPAVKVFGSRKPKATVRQRQRLVAGAARVARVAHELRFARGALQTAH